MIAKEMKLPRALKGADITLRCTVQPSPLKSMSHLVRNKACCTMEEFQCFSAFPKYTGNKKHTQQAGQETTTITCSSEHLKETSGA